MKEERRTSRWRLFTGNADDEHPLAAIARVENNPAKDRLPPAAMRRVVAISGTTVRPNAPGDPRDQTNCSSPMTMLRTTEQPQLHPVTTTPKPHAPLHISDLLSLLALGALWGASFLFMRIAAPEFGPVPLIEVRLIIATLVLLPILFARERAQRTLTHRLPHLIFLGLFNSAIPFCFLAYATLSLTAGFASILNSIAPFFAAIVAFLWLRDRLSPPRILGLVIGFAGVLVLVWGKASFKPGGSGSAILAGLAAALCYGFAANYAKKYLAGISPLRTTTVSLFTSTLCLAPLTLLFLPDRIPSFKSWLAVIALAVFSTGLAYLLYYRLIERIGPARAVAVTFLIPAFGILWGYLFLHEPLTLRMLIATPIILTGTALSTGLLPPPKPTT